MCSSGWSTSARATLGVAPEEIRARNFVKPEQMPYHTLTDRDYDVGDFEGAMRACLAKADYAGFAARAEEARKRGKIRGFGISSYIECTAWGDGEKGSVTLEKNGDFTVLIGTQSNGQGHETAYAQVVSQYLDVPLERIKVVQGDTDRVATGDGTGGSRSIPVGAVMVDPRLADAGRLAEGAGGRQARGRGRRSRDRGRHGPHRRNGPRDLLCRDRRAARSDGGETDGDRVLRAAERDLSQRHPRLRGRDRPGDRRDDDRQATPSSTISASPSIRCLLAGQVHGGIAQGAGQALMERAVYDDDGQLLTASLMDYCMPRADDLPAFDFETRNVPSTTNPMGLKGAGEAGSIGSTPAVMNAVADALWRAYRDRAHRHARDPVRGLPRDSQLERRALEAGRPAPLGRPPQSTSAAQGRGRRRAMVGDFGDERRQ